MPTQFIFIALFIVSIFTTLTVQGIKSLFSDDKWERIPTNIVTVIVALVLSVGITVGYLVMTETQINIKIAVELIALMYLSFLVATNGYDKVLQALKQIQGGCEL